MVVGRILVLVESGTINLRKGDFKMAAIWTEKASAKVRKNIKEDFLKIMGTYKGQFALEDLSSALKKIFSDGQFMEDVGYSLSITNQYKLNEISKQFHNRLKEFEKALQTRK